MQRRVNDGAGRTREIHAGSGGPRRTSGPVTARRHGSTKAKPLRTNKAKTHMPAAMSPTSQVPEQPNSGVASPPAGREAGAIEGAAVVVSAAWASDEEAGESSAFMDTADGTEAATKEWPGRLCPNPEFPPAQRCMPMIPAMTAVSVKSSTNIGGRRLACPLLRCVITDSILRFTGPGRALLGHPLGWEDVEPGWHPAAEQPQDQEAPFQWADISGDYRRYVKAGGRRGVDSVVNRWQSSLTLRAPSKEK